VRAHPERFITAKQDAMARIVLFMFDTPFYKNDYIAPLIEFGQPAMSA
jgi:hypothetical protein